ncbi:MAG: transpeptidase family protein [Deltaproteobacteria bacterium]|jgi:cell division protein FtsI (penicillin-binding protein 3)|nr:transpeptidase family protein [Deltaproteobacteria bacterium]
MRPLPINKQKRLRLLLLGFTLVFLAIIVRAAELQLVKRDILLWESKKKSEISFDLGSVRGDIYDRNGEKLASSLAMDSVYLDGNLIKDRGAAFLALSKVLDIDYEALAKIFEDLKSIPGTSATAPDRPLKNRTYAWVKRHISEMDADAIRALKIRGVRLEKEYRRVYPNGSLAAHILGFVRKTDGVALEGLELALDGYLRKNPVGIVVRQDRLGRIIMDRPDQKISQQMGASVMLTIDRQIQRLTEKALSKAVEERNAKSGQALVVRIRTGEILASAVYPTFDPNNYQSSEPENRRNTILTDPFEPGSTFKVFTVAAALEEKLINPETIFFCENGLYKIDGANASIKDTASYGDLSVNSIVQVSSNIGATKIGETLGPYKLYNYLTRFAFGEKTGLAYPSSESAGKLRHPREWRALDAASVAFGQALSVTSLQMTMAVAALANGGVLMRPTLVSRIIDADGRIIEQKPPKMLRPVVSQVTANQVLYMMRLAVKKGTGRRADIPGYPVAGKTATAQSVISGSSSYSKDKYVASFVGVAPYEKPELCVFVALFEPWPAYYGGEVAAPVFKEIMQAALPLLDIPMVDEPAEPIAPMETKVAGAGSIPGVVSDSSPTNFLMVKIKKNDRGAAGQIRDLKKDFQGYAAESLEFDGLAEVKELVKPPTPGGEPGVMPNVKGLSMREVMDLLSPFRLSLEYEGSGLAIYQFPSSGAPVEAGQMARISFGDQ